MIELELATERPVQALDVTQRLLDGQYPDGFIWVSVPHTTAGLLLCENDPEMLADVEVVARGLLAGFEPFRHRKNNNPNGNAHLMSSLMGTQLLLPVTAGRIALGTYQRVIFVELDGPRTGRRICIASLPQQALSDSAG